MVQKSRTTNWQREHGLTRLTASSARSHAVSHHAHGEDEDREEEVLAAAQGAAWTGLEVVGRRQAEEQHLQQLGHRGEGEGGVCHTF